MVLVKVIRKLRLLVQTRFLILEARSAHGSLSESDPRHDIARRIDDGRCARERGNVDFDFFFDSTFETEACSETRERFSRTDDRTEV